MEQPWRVDDVRGPQGSRPVKAFLDALSKHARAKVYAAPEMLAREGNRLRFPKSRPMGGGPFELRIPHPEGPYRIIYCYRPGRQILLLHAFVKRTEQTPSEDLRLARERKPS